MNPQSLLFGLCLWVAPSLIGCSSEGPKQLVHDLARRSAFAERSSARDVIRFGTPNAETVLVDGFRGATIPAFGDPFALAQPGAEIALTWPTTAPRLGLLDVAPYQGVQDQSVEVFLNEGSVARFPLKQGRHTYRIPLPAEAQRTGQNRVRFAFGSPASPAATAFGFTTGPAADAALEALLARDAPSPFSIIEEGGAPSLVLVAPSSIRYALRLPRDGELRFRPDLHPAARGAGGRASFRVTLETAPGGARELWSRVIRSGHSHPAEVRLGLPGEPGSIVRLALHVGPISGEPFAWGTWAAPRVLGRPPLPTTAPAAVIARAGGLRELVRNMNVLLVVLDAARAQQLSCYGYGRATTPEIERIAAEGALFEQAITPAVYTLGAMASVWTSQHPHLHRAGAAYGSPLPPSALTLAEVLSARGIHTVGFVANPMAGRAFGLGRGFSELQQGRSNADVLIGRVSEWLRANKARRFFAYVHVREPHFPYDPPPPFDTLFGPEGPIPKAQRSRGPKGQPREGWIGDIKQGRRPFSQEELSHLIRLYDGNLAFADQQIGVLKKSLESEGLWQKTVVIITADHGQAFREHGFIGHNVQLYEESVRVPLIIRIPGMQGAKRLSALVDLTDLAPTVADLFGSLGQGATAREFRGRSLLPVLAGEAGKPAVLCRSVQKRPSYAIRDDRYKLIYDTASGATELYDIVTDAKEARNLVPVDPIRAAFYREALLEWISEPPSTRRATEEEARLTGEECENLQALGYVGVPGCPK